MRFAKGNIFAASLGLAPGEHSSGSGVHRLGITKAGNTHLRTLLIEAASGICKGAIGHKSKALKARQAGQDSEVIAYADKANTRLRSKYYRMVRRGKSGMSLLPLWQGNWHASSGEWRPGIPA